MEDKAEETVVLGLNQREKSGRQSGGDSSLKSQRGV